MRKKSSYFALLLSIIMVLGSFSMVYGEPEQTEGVMEPVVVSVFNYTEPEEGQEAPEVPILKLEEITESVTAEDGTVTETKKTIFKQEDSNLFGFESAEHNAFMTAAKESLKADVRNGLNICMTDKVTKGHIKLDVWGEFLNKYLGKETTQFPSANSIDIKFGGYYVRLADTKVSRNYIKNTFLPDLLSVMEEVSKEYPLYKFALQFDDGCLLKDYKFNMDNVRLVGEVYPLDGLGGYENYQVLNTGAYFAFNLGTDYVDVLRGYIEGNENTIDKSVTVGDKKGSLNVLSYIVLLQSIDGPVSEMELSDFTIYNDLAVRLDTKELINTNDLTTNEKSVAYADFKIVDDILVLAPISDTAVIVQPTYLECFNYGGWDKNFGRKIDFTDFIANNSDTVKVEGTNITIPVEYFADSSKMLDTRLGNAPFLVYYSSHTPYDMLVKWAYENNLMTDGERSQFLNRIKSDLKKAGRETDFDKYVKAAGQMTSGTKSIILIIVIVVLLIVALVVFLIINKKRKTTAVDVAEKGPLFKDDDDEDDYDDSSVGDFDLM